MLSQDNIIQDNIAQVKTLCNVLFEAPDKSAQEKLQFNVVVRLFVQHSTGQNPMRCCPRGPSQYCIIKNQVQICLNDLGTTLHRSIPEEIFHSMLLACSDETVWIFSCAMLFGASGTTLHRVFFYEMLSKKY